MIKIEIICDGRMLQPYRVSDPLGPRTVVGLKEGEEYQIRLRPSRGMRVAVRVFRNGREQRPGIVGIYPWQLGPGEQKTLPQWHFFQAELISATVHWSRLYDPQTVAVELWPWETLQAKLREDYPEMNYFSRFSSS